MPSVQLEGEVVSTTRVRDLLLQGNVEQAEKLLQRPYMLSGTVVHGAHRGKGLGFPTANLKCDLPSVSLRRGVYVTRAKVQGMSGMGFQAVTNVGLNPTFTDGEQVRIETHQIGRAHV